MSPVATPEFVNFSGGDIVLYSFYALILLYAGFTAVLYYHWQTYSADARVSFITIVTYFVITIPLILSLSAATILF